MEERENKKLGTILNYAIIVCIAAILIMIICGIVGKFLDKKTNRIGEFSERHPRLNMVIALALVVIMGTAGYVSIYYIVCKVKEIIHWIADMASKMDAVVIVALITGTVSIIGVIISSIVAKIIDYKKSRQEYLAKKREIPYGEFVEMIYKVQGAEAEEKIRKRANTYNAFRFDSIRTNLGATWQEDTIFMLLSRDLREADSDGKVLGTDKKNIIRIKDDIDNKDVKFIVETILFYSFGDIPSDECILAHCEMIRREIINKTDLFNLSISSSCKFIEKLFEKKLTGDWRKDTRFVEMLKAFQVYMTPNDIRRIQQMHIPLSKVQIGVYKKFCESKYKDIEEIKELHGIRDYFEDKDVITGIDKTYFEMLSVKFDELAENSERDIILAVSFYYYMIFLIRVKKENMYIDNQRIQSEMLRIKKLWSTNYYEDVVKSMQVISSQQRISAQKCNEFSKRIMINPILFSNLTMSYDQNKILKEMMKAAENPLIMLVSNIEISEVFPREGAKVNYKRHDIDAKFLEIISEIVENKGYKLLNKMLPEKFVAYIYQNCKIELQLNITLFNEEEKMYNLIKAKAPIELLEYDKKISLAMITQLFPVLEMQIRKLVSYLGIFPYKIDEEEFMQCNDPSSLLRELLLQIYNEQKSFENVSDIMFVYNSMYNSNFLNIRNECIHGRDYLAGGKLRYAFRVTLLCIYMVMFRIDTIEEKVSDLID